MLFSYITNQKSLFYLLIGIGKRQIIFYYIADDRRAHTVIDFACLLNHIFCHFLDHGLIYWRSCDRITYFFTAYNYIFDVMIIKNSGYTLYLGFLLYFQKKRILWCFQRKGNHTKWFRWPLKRSDSIFYFLGLCNFSINNIKK